MMDAIKTYERKLDRTLGQYPIALQLERQTGVNKVHLVLLAVSVVLLGVLYRLFTATFIALTLFVYPAVQSIKSIEKHDKAADVHWLTYWLAISLLTTIESLLGPSKLSSKIPLYNLFKLGFTIWMFSPRTRGSLLVYERALRPVYRRIEAAVLAYAPFSKASPVTSAKANLARATTQDKTSSSNLSNAQQKVKKASEDVVGEVKSQAASTGSINKDKAN
jgi:hypothetical protein